eukprot:CAMPEP_0206441326 /NCGR_PEP_ID=MMETSP0324_2-20121206/13220_1 /ASSEMBLY_ACC=CAM_ASM_000836 /TAXON_ID=2866 /ORGANISM="Crypthecodinium cohnii, Strain Seligo" /LENGTH=778 /DNA_ID=CAMNT_0053909077 /DNA_START=135 /DNA_END=2471 /DNA_ORIENTATION=+
MAGQDFESSALVLASDGQGDNQPHATAGPLLGTMVPPRCAERVIELEAGIETLQMLYNEMGKVVRTKASTAKEDNTRLHEATKARFNELEEVVHAKADLLSVAKKEDLQSVQSALRQKASQENLQSLREEISELRSSIADAARIFKEETKTRSLQLERSVKQASLDMIRSAQEEVAADMRDMHEALQQSITSSGQQAAKLVSEMVGPLRSQVAECMKALSEKSETSQIEELYRLMSTKASATQVKDLSKTLDVIGTEMAQKASDTQVKDLSKTLDVIGTEMAQKASEAQVKSLSEMLDVIGTEMAQKAAITSLEDLQESVSALQGSQERVVGSLWAELSKKAERELLSKLATKTEVQKGFEVEREAMSKFAAKAEVQSSIEALHAKTHEASTAGLEKLEALTQTVEGLELRYTVDSDYLRSGLQEAKQVLLTKASTQEMRDGLKASSEKLAEEIEKMTLRLNNKVDVDTVPSHDDLESLSSTLDFLRTTIEGKADVALTSSKEEVKDVQRRLESSFQSKLDTSVTALKQQFCTQGQSAIDFFRRDVEQLRGELANKADVGACTTVEEVQGMLFGMGSSVTKKISNHTAELDRCLKDLQQQLDTKASREEVALREDLEQVGDILAEKADVMKVVEPSEFEEFRTFIDESLKELRTIIGAKQLVGETAALTVNGEGPRTREGWCFQQKATTPVGPIDASAAFAKETLQEESFQSPRRQLHFDFQTGAATPGPRTPGTVGGASTGAGGTAALLKRRRVGLTPGRGESEPTPMGSRNVGSLF